MTRTTPDGLGAIVASGLVEHFFRHEYGRLVAVLTRTVGLRHLDVVEDAVQGALLTALASWTAEGVPNDPGAWLYRVAYNSFIDDLRRKTGRLRILAQAGDRVAQESHDLPASRFSREVADDTLRMLFICCDGPRPRLSSAL